MGSVPPPSRAVTATDRLVAAVRVMRDHQRDWFSGDKSPGKLEAARRSEREVDRLLREIAGGQGALF